MGTIAWLIFLLLIAIAGFVIERIMKKEVNSLESDQETVNSRKIGEYKHIAFRSKITAFSALGLILFSFITCGIYTIDEGEAVLLRRFGNVYAMETKPGSHIKQPWANSITWNIRENVESINLEARTKDDMECPVDITIWWKPDPSRLEHIYANIAQDQRVLQEGFVIPALRSGIRDMISLVTYSTLNTDRVKQTDLIFKHVTMKLAEKSIIVKGVNIRKVSPPEAVDKSINEKLQMEQDALKETMKMEKVKAAAKNRVIEAQGIADAQRIIQGRLTPLYVQWYAIEMQKQLAKSPNTTFYFVPMGRNSGLPMTFNSPLGK